MFPLRKNKNLSQNSPQNITLSEAVSVEIKYECVQCGYNFIISHCTVLWK